MVKQNANYSSWGRFPASRPAEVQSLEWRTRLPDFSEIETSVLPYAYGRSYGDSCLNNGGVLLDVTPLNQFIFFDRDNGIIRCEAGVSLEEILKLIVPNGWFLPVTPGTKFVSVGGAIANDVHGKNHHASGTFGCHVTQFELLRSDGERLICSPQENIEFFRATIGGMGLTGVILWAEFTLRKIPSPLIQSEEVRFDTLEEFFRLSEESKDIEYTVSWVDCSATGENLGRGLFGRGDFYDPPLGLKKPAKSPLKLAVPLEMPLSLVTPLTANLFNKLYYNKHFWERTKHGVGHYDAFFYPLDAIHDWHRVYGTSGFLQYQFVLPFEGCLPALRDIFKRIAKSGQGSPLVVFKTFGDVKSPGYMSFPRKGVTLALDFPYRGQTTLRLLDELDDIVFSFEQGSALYPAKDARMSGEHFRRSFPCWEEFATYIDPKFSSSFWRRVTADVSPMLAGKLADKVTV